MSFVIFFSAMAVFSAVFLVWMIVSKGGPQPLRALYIVWGVVLTLCCVAMAYESLRVPA